MADFSQALKDLKLAGQVKRTSWTGPINFIVMYGAIDDSGSPPNTIMQEIDGLPATIWGPSNADICAEDWEIVS